MAMSVHAFQMSEEEPADAECNGDDDSSPAYREWELPSRAFSSLWDALIYEKERATFYQSQHHCCQDQCLLSLPNTLTA